MLKNAWKGIVNWWIKKDRATVQSFKPLFGRSSNQKGRAWISWRKIWSMHTNCLDMLALGTYWKTWYSTVSQQTCPISHKMDSSLWPTFGQIDFLYPWHKWLPSILSCGKRSTALPMRVISRLRLCWGSWRFEINIRRSYVFFGSRTFVPISWMCKKQTSVSHSSTESEIISLDAGLRIPALDLWDIVMDVLCSTQGNANSNRHQLTGNQSKNKDHTQTQANDHQTSWFSNMDQVPVNAHTSHCVSSLYIFEDSEAVIKMINKGRRTTMRHVSRTHRVALDWLFDRINLNPKIQIKHVDTKNQLADMLTKGSFTRD